MLTRKPKFSKITAVIGLAITINFCLTSFSSVVQAEEQNSNSHRSRSTVNKNENSNSKHRNGLPTHRIGGGSRGNCIANQGQLVALVPENSVAITASNTPKLFFYVPETTQSHLIEFVVRNQQDELVYESMLQKGNRAGIITVELPANLQQDELKTNEDYHWYLSMVCDRQKRSHDVVVEGWIRRVELEPALNQKLQQASIIEQANFYQNQGIWYDALSVIAGSKKSVDSQLTVKAKWVELLDSIGLKELAHEPIIEVNNYSSSADRLVTHSSQ